MLQRWAHAYRDSVYHAAVNRNNGTEAQNKLFKYNFLPCNKQRATVSAITTLLVEDYLPMAYQKYLVQNYKQTSTYRAYNDFVPDYLLDRPRNIILHCLDRMARSHKLTASNIINHDNDQEKGSFGNDNPDSMPSCTCQDWTNWHIPCKHFFSIFKHRAAWQWSNLPPSYLPNMNTYKWFCYNPLCGNRLAFPSQDPPPKQLSRLNHIELLNVNGCHYDYKIIH